MAIRDRVLEHCFGPYQGDFEDGQVANNMLDLERIRDIPDLRQEVIEALGQLITPYEPQFVSGVPDGANWLANDLAWELNLISVHLTRLSENRDNIDFLYPEDRIACNDLDRGIVVEGVFNRYKSTRNVLTIQSLGHKAMAAVSIWDRGVTSEREELSIPTQSLIVEPIPAMLESDSALWNHAKS
jgi:hypothetical protein